METLFLIAVIAGQRVALDAAEIESVVEIDAITRVPRAADHVLGLAALRSRVLTVIDSHAALGLGAAPPAAIHEAVVIKVEGHLYALVVDSIEDVAAFAPPLPVTAALGANWARVAIGTVDHADGVLLVADTSAIISGQLLAA
jgi:purine-binding chemotaxis protein CheW